MYTGKDHTEAAFNRVFTDRVPVRVWYAVGDGGEMPGVTRKEVRTEGDKYARYILWVQDRISSDSVTVAAFDMAMAAEFAGDGPGISIREVIDLSRRGIALLKDKSVFSRFKPSDLMQGTRLPYYVEACEKVVAGAADTAVDVIITAPWTTAALLRGEVDLIYDTKDDPAFVHELLRFATEYTKAVGLKIAGTGVNMITLGDPSSGCSVISPKIFREWSRPYLEEAVRYLRENTDARICLHVCGNIDDIMEDLITTGVEGISIDGPTSLERMVRVNRGRVVIIGNIPTELFIEGTKEQLEEQVRNCVDTAAAESGFILSSGCTVPGTEENVIHTIQYARKYGRYSWKADT
jgi:uroporphyrinogen decarboxylase